MKQLLKRAFGSMGLEIRRITRPDAAYTNLPDRNLYRPLFSPWYSSQSQALYAIAAPRTLVSEDRCYVLATLLRQALHLPGDIFECGVYRGGTAAMIARILRDARSDKKLYLFDTFEGMPETDPARDLHRAGDFSDTTATAVAKFVNAPDIAVLRKGFIPDTFAGLEDRQVAFAHIDVDIYRSILDSLAFIWPRLSPSGFVVFDDYGFPSCPGARAAVDEFFADKNVEPLCLQTGQAVVSKLV
ncbi:MAG: class I SAM-dependent methyltransferase [Alphaproteobacteria bacterium]|nr:class I SAM-dependent methyltransferase [Alphaproteobacteria bacterium]MBL6939067.1 class I SAM-dependent methyltransferase [Alphaproteobacteria bacterium]MBL7099659.1 class I SAM-dependent methyltransferase [Alphaproteobacteria bacterium]